MKLYFTGDLAGLEDGIGMLSKELGFEISPEGMKIEVVKAEENILAVEKDCKGGKISFRERAHFFRALGLFMESAQGTDTFLMSEEPQFTMNSVMLDVSQNNAVMRPEKVERLLLRMALMGLDTLFLYTEDGFDIKDEPYFGYMRGRYTFEEMKSMDDFADMLGIEIVPCIQTLAHLIDALKWDCFIDIREDDDTLLVGCDKAYEFIEKMMRSVSAPFRTKRIHVGLDEAWHLGETKYRKLHGCRSKSDIMNEHFGRVMEITEKLGLQPMMWSDMFFRSNSKSGDYHDTDFEFPKALLDKVPEDLQQVYWEYGNADEDFHRRLLKKHKELCKNPVFAGGVWCWYGFGVNYGVSFANTNAALSACKKEGIREVMVTLWGDDGVESNMFSTLLGLQLFAEHGFSRELDEEKLKRRFKFCTGGSFEDFMGIRYMDEIPGINDGNQRMANPCKYLLWQDIMLGLFDGNIEGLKLGSHYGRQADRMLEAVGRNGEFGFIFEFLAKVCRALEIKAEIGLRITGAYKSKDKAALKEIADSVLPELAGRIADLHGCHRRIWIETNKPAGWEVLDLRYGLVTARVGTAIARINDYLSGKVGRLEELDEERLLYNGRVGLVAVPEFNNIATGSRVSMTTRYFIW